MVDFLALMPSTVKKYLPRRAGRLVIIALTVYNEIRFVIWLFFFWRSCCLLSVCFLSGAFLLFFRVMARVVVLRQLHACVSANAICMFVRYTVSTRRQRYACQGTCYAELRLNAYFGENAYSNAVPLAWNQIK